MGLWNQMVAPRLTGTTPGSSSDASWVGCVTEARIARGQWASPAAEAIDKETEADIASAEGLGDGEDSGWTSQFLNLKGDPTLARLVRRFGPPCGLGFTGGSIYLRFPTTVLVPVSSKECATAAAEGTPGDATTCAEEAAELELEVEDPGGDDGDDGVGNGEDVTVPAAVAKDAVDDPVHLCVDVQYRRWESAPAPQSVRSFHDMNLIRDSAAFLRGQHGLYALSAVPIRWHQPGVSIFSYDPGVLLLLTGVTSASEDAIFLSREVSAGWGVGEVCGGGGVGGGGGEM